MRNKLQVASLFRCTCSAQLRPLVAKWRRVSPSTFKNDCIQLLWWTEEEEEEEEHLHDYSNDAVEKDGDDVDEKEMKK